MDHLTTTFPIRYSLWEPINGNVRLRAPLFFVFFFATKDKCEVMVNLLLHSFQLHIVNRKLLTETC